MTRLSLHSRDENPKLSIRLSIGQYCTVGSSAAADYQFRAVGIDPVHCRIGCRSTGGYIECLDLNSSIVVNGVVKDRSRLTHGNTLRIGAVELNVDMPGLEVPIKDFEVRFEDEESPTTKVAEALAMDQESEPTPANPPANPPAIPPANPLDDQDHFGPLETASEFALHRSDEISDDDENRSAEPSSLASPLKPESDESDDPQSTGSSSTTKYVPSAEHHDDGSPDGSPSTRSITFQFDSAEPDDLDLSQAEIDQMTESSPQQLEGNVDLESAIEGATASKELSDTEFSSNHLNPPDDSNPELPSDAEVARDALPDGVDAGKHWKWTNTRAIAALRLILESDPELKTYQCDIKQIKRIDIEEFSMRWFKQQKTVVYLISRLDENELNNLTRTRRWDERIGHPQAVTMFLALSPKRIVSEFFDSIPACVLMNEELELLRRDNQLSK